MNQVNIKITAQGWEMKANIDGKEFTQIVKIDENNYYYTEQDDFEDCYLSVYFEDIAKTLRDIEKGTNKS